MSARRAGRETGKERLLRAACSSAASDVVVSREDRDGKPQPYTRRRTVWRARVSPICELVS